MKINPDITRLIKSLNTMYEWAKNQGWAPSDRKFIEAMVDTMESEMNWLHIPDNVVETLFLWIVDPDSLPYSVDYGLKILRQRH